MTDHDTEVLDGELEPAAPEPAKPYIQPQVDQLPAETTPDQLLAVAVQRGDPVEKIEKLLELKERYEAQEARKAYTAAMAEFKRNAPVIFKDKQVNYENRDGTMTRYNHATLGAIALVIAESLGKFGLSHRWETEQEGAEITVTCIVTHELGHSEQTVLSAAPDTSGGKNSIQAVGSTNTYLQRYTLLAATGLAALEGIGSDDDAVAAGMQFITEEQVMELAELVARLPTDQEGRWEGQGAFERAMRIEGKTFAELPASRFKQAKAVLEKKAGGGRRGR